MAGPLAWMPPAGVQFQDASGPADGGWNAGWRQKDRSMGWVGPRRGRRRTVNPPRSPTPSTVLQVRLPAEGPGNGKRSTGVGAWLRCPPVISPKPEAKPMLFLPALVYCLHHSALARPMRNVAFLDEGQALGPKVAPDRAGAAGCGPSPDEHPRNLPRQRGDRGSGSGGSAQACPRQAWHHWIQLGGVHLRPGRGAGGLTGAWHGTPPAWEDRLLG